MTNNFFWLLLAATIGVISPSGNEVGPFLSIEQAALSQLLPGERRTMTFAWYNLVGSFATATGALVGGWTCELTRQTGALGPEIYRPVIWGYAGFGLVLTVMFFKLSPSTEVRAVSAGQLQAGHSLGLSKSRRIILKLSALFSLDAFGGGFIVQSVLAYWFYQRFQIHEESLGEVFFGANLLAGVSALAAGWMANRFGLINTMVFTHLPSNVLLLIVPLMPNYYWAVAILWIRFSISQMDVPTRQSYVMAVVAPEERAAAAGVTAIARSIGTAISPWIAVSLIANPMTSDAIFYACGTLKIVYDLLLYREFGLVKPREGEGRT
jgi:MFS family permease